MKNYFSRKIKDKLQNKHGFGRYSNHRYCLMIVVLLLLSSQECFYYFISIVSIWLRYRLSSKFSIIGLSFSGYPFLFKFSLENVPNLYPSVWYKVSKAEYFIWYPGNFTFGYRISVQRCPFGRLTGPSLIQIYVWLYFKAFLL